MSPSPVIDLSALVAEVTRAQGVAASAIALINGFAARIQAAVDTALAADDAADEGTAQAVREAIAGEAAKLSEASAQLESAITANS